MSLHSEQSGRRLPAQSFTLCDHFHPLISCNPTSTEDNSAVIKMINRSGNLKMRNVSRTHRGDCIFIRYVNTKEQIADTVTTQEIPAVGFEP